VTPTSLEGAESYVGWCPSCLTYGKTTWTLNDIFMITTRTT